MTVFFYLLDGISAFFKTFGVELLFLVAMLIFSVLIAGVLAPLGALSWWAGWARRKGNAAGGEATEAETEAEALVPPVILAQPVDTTRPVEHFIVYLSGIADISATFLQAIELGYVNALEEALPSAHIIDDIFAFSVTNVGLTEEDRMGRFWHWMKQINSRPGKAAVFSRIAINGRNMLQVAVSADSRYGPVFNYGTANTIFQNVIEAGYVPGSGMPVTLIGYSGGGQVGLASAQYLKPALDGPLQVISVGGVMSDSAGIDAADEIIHLDSKLDPIQALGDYLFPRRWPLARSSRWNRALASGKLRRIDMGPMLHSGPQGYFGPDAVLADGRSHRDATVALTVELINSFRARTVKR
ncbi:hypothetical protein [Candidatus Chloroploca sp. Khr17]|uniref:hypothetical protein n=1 Tax=Candidatus Chloroploca sp. Khr17 TaxID=2496869 RepID=UPI00101C6D0D|nr:hypothetical protein [Candidatus Chloroploca sp. Khr17]